MGQYVVHVEADIAQHAGLNTGQYRAKATIADSVAQGIVDFARRECVGPIATYSRDRKGIARIVNGSIASGVRATRTN